MLHERLPRRSPAAVKEFLERTGWVLNRTYAVYEQGPLSIQEVMTRSQPQEVEHYARALAVGLGELRKARGVKDGVLSMRESVLDEFEGTYKHDGCWSRTFGPWGCTVKILEQVPGGVLYIRYGTRRTSRSLKHKDKARAITTAQERVEELRGKDERRGAAG